MRYGYARVSTLEQNEERQIIALKEKHVDKIFIDKASGKNFDRPQYAKMRSLLNQGDVLFIDSFDRLGRNYKGLISEWNAITKEIGCDIVCLDSTMFDSIKFREMGDIGVLMEDMMLSMLAYFADSERKKTLERQAAGIAVAKSQGKYKGRKPIEIDGSVIEQCISDINAGLKSVNQCARELDISLSTFYKLRMLNS